MNAAYVFHCADVERVLGAEIARVSCFDFTAGDIVIAFFLQSNYLGFGQDSTRGCDVLFQRIKTLFEVR